MARYVVICICLGAMLSWPGATACPAERQRFEFQQLQMGMQFKLALYASDEAAANAAARAVWQRLKELNRMMSDYEPESELMQLCQTAGQGRAVPISPELFGVLDRARRLSEASGGAFDVTVAPAVQVWRRARRSRQFPSPREIEAVRALIDYRNLLLDERARTVELRQPGMRLDLGGIAVGYAIDDVLKLLRERGITSALVDGSGDIGVSDPPPGTKGWRVGVAPLQPEAPPSQYLLLDNASVTTSGDAWQFVEFEGVRYSHIVDPHTGLGLTARMSVTVAAPNCTVADSYATAVCVLGTERGLALIEQTPGAAALIVRTEGDGTTTTTSRRWGQYVDNDP